MKKHLLLIPVAFMMGCAAPEEYPDKTAEGAVVGAGILGGAGAVIGHQIGKAGEGLGVGAGFGVVSGALSGLAYDALESEIGDNRKELASLRTQNLENRRSIAELQSILDNAIASDGSFGVYQVYFDEDATNLKTGSIANLEAISDAIRKSPSAHDLLIIGHADDSGSPDYNERLAEARAREVSSYLAHRGISADQIRVESHGSKRPIASNTTPQGRQLNRRVDIFFGSAARK